MTNVSKAVYQSLPLDVESRILDGDPFFNCSTDKQMKPYGDPIGSALDIIVVQPSLLAFEGNYGADNVVSEDINKLQNMSMFPSNTIVCTRIH